jgi:hypothetical protein
MKSLVFICSLLELSLVLLGSKPDRAKGDLVSFGHPRPSTGAIRAEHAAEAGRAVLPSDNGSIFRLVERARGRTF